MRNIVACYNEHAIKVSDSYCSGPSNHPYISSNTKNPSNQNTVTCIYKLNISTKTPHIFIKFTWSHNQFFTFTIIDDSTSNSNGLQARTIKGSKRLLFQNSKVELIWDLSNAKYESGPEPVNGFYIAILIDSEINLLLGNVHGQVEEKSLNFKTKKFSLVSRTINFWGNAVYSAMTGFIDDGKSHQVLIKCSAEDKGMKNWVLGVWIDTKNAIEVKRLKWNFRGNQTIFVDGLLVDFMWDVYDWFFNPKSGSAVFMFRPRSGLDSRLWMEEKISNSKEHDNNIAFSSLICVCKSPLNFLIH